MKYLKLINFFVVFWMVLGTLSAQSYIPDLYNPRDSIGLYNINVEINKYNFSGLLLLKKTNDSTIRLVMNSEMGPKLLDMELLPSGYKIIYAFKKLNKKRILKIFYEDFGALCCIIIRKKCPIVDNNLSSTEFTFNMGKKRKIIYTADSLSHKFISGRIEERKTSKSIFHYFYAPGTSEISSMKLKHQNFRMTILLNKIGF